VKGRNYYKIPDVPENIQRRQRTWTKKRENLEKEEGPIGESGRRSHGERKLRGEETFRSDTGRKKRHWKGRDENNTLGTIPLDKKSKERDVNKNSMKGARDNQAKRKFRMWLRQETEELHRRFLGQRKKCD